MNEQDWLSQDGKKNISCCVFSLPALNDCNRRRFQWREQSWLIQTEFDTWENTTNMKWTPRRIFTRVEMEFANVCSDAGIRGRRVSEQEGEWRFDWLGRFLHILSRSWNRRECPDEEKKSMDFVEKGSDLLNFIFLRTFGIDDISQK